MPLVIVESKIKVPAIKKILGPGYDVAVSYGHIMDLEKKNMGIDIDTWTPKYKVNSDKKDVVRELKTLAKEHSEIYIATDPDLEGCCIGHNLLSIFPKSKKIYRLKFNSITKEAILDGIKNPPSFDKNAFKAQQVRRMIDRIVGFKVSPVMWAKGLRNTSAGRVQSTALKLIVDRERSIRKFKPDEYWSIKANMEKNFETTFYGVNNKKYVPKTKASVDRILNDLNKKLIVSKCEKKQRVRKPSPPFDTAALQQEAGTKFGWKSKKVMDLAQNLFSSSMITYPRTDSIRVVPEKIKFVRDMIEKKYGKQYLSAKPIHYAPKSSAQGAHEAIRPTFKPQPMTLTSDERKLLNLIGNRFIASQMANAVFDQVSLQLESKSEKVYQFRSNGSVLVFDGFLKVYGNAGENTLLPLLNVGESLEIKNINPAQHFTKPLPRFTEPKFVGTMKKEGIGRPATYVASIEVLLERKYIVRDKKMLKPTEIGIMVCEYLEKNFNSITSTQFTADMESKLDQIALGTLEKNETLDKFYGGLLQEIDEAKKSTINLFVTDKECSRCNDGSNMIKKLGTHGIFFGCENHPKCGHILSIGKDGEFVENSVDTGNPCPECGSKILIKKGPYGKWAYCEGYPACSWKGNVDADGNIVQKKPIVYLKIKCPKCDKKLKKNKSKYKDNEFWAGCSGYPKCKFTSGLDSNDNLVQKKSKKSVPSKKLGKSCPKCKNGELLEIKGEFGKFIGCSEFRNGCKYMGKVKGK